MMADKYPNAKTEIFENTIKIKFYIGNTIYKVFRITENETKLNVTFLPSQVMKSMDINEIDQLFLVIDKQCHVKEHSPQKIKALKKRFKVGTYIKLIKMYDLDIQAPPPGTIGFVTSVDDAGTIHMLWNDGSTAGLVVGTDEFRII